MHQQHLGIFGHENCNSFRPMIASPYIACNASYVSR